MKDRPKFKVNQSKFTLRVSWSDRAKKPSYKKIKASFEEEEEEEAEEETPGKKGRRRKKRRKTRPLNRMYSAYSKAQAS